MEWNKVINEYIQSENGPEIDSFHHDSSICKMLIRGCVFQHNQLKFPDSTPQPNAAFITPTSKYIFIPC